MDSGIYRKSVINLKTAED